MELDSLTAVSPLDGRYATRTAPLREIVSEYGLLRLRVIAELAWFRTLAEEPGLPELPALEPAAAAQLDAIGEQFDVHAARRIKDIEAKTNHDVKAVEYFLKERIADIPGLAPHVEFVHFACTSEDINNVAHALMLRQVTEQVLLPAMDALIDEIATEMAIVIANCW